MGTAGNSVPIPEETDTQWVINEEENEQEKDQKAVFRETEITNPLPTKDPGKNSAIL